MLTRKHQVAPRDEISQSVESRGSSPEREREDTTTSSGVFADEKASTEQVTLSNAVDDVAAIPKGTIDPVYEAKARVLNHAVSPNYITRYA